VSDYWTERALPVLEALNKPSDPQFVESRILTLGRGRGRKTLGLELSEEAIYETVLQLADAGYVEYSHVTFPQPAGAHVFGLIVSGRGMQILGEWPRFELFISPQTLAALLEALADYVPEEEAKPMRRSARFIRKMAGTSLKAIIVGVGSHYAKQSLGLP
jgi:hypothetical protein